MANQFRFIILTLVMAILATGCAGGAFGGFRAETEAIDSTTVTRQVRFYEQGQTGPVYDITLTVPEDWVDTFETTNDGRQVVFNLRNENGTLSPIFTVEALSFSQYWEQNGSYPQEYVNLKNTPDTYFIYSVPRVAFYSGLPQDEFEALAAVVPDVVATFEATLANGNMAVVN